MNRISLFLVFLCLFLIFINFADSKKKSRKHKHGGDDDEEEEEDEDDTFECLDCKGVNCTNNTAEECLLCFTLTSLTTELRGCVEDKAEAKAVEDGTCVDDFKKNDISGKICYCEEDLCNKHDYTKSGIATSSCLLLVVFAALLNAYSFSL